ncbi:hypothetical protein [Maribacter sp.]|uniref:hypothetical protein n=1 Tax=Maribacter sp. TaxID=1897614 RepID=UPI0025BD6A93|nr:hypothetical protein [Maribacter sp.]
MDERWTLGVLGLYTVIYLVVFFVHKSQIDRQKDVISSMKSFMEVFKVDEVKKFVELKENRMIMQFEDEMKNDGNLREMTEKIVLERIEPLKKVYIDQMGEQHLEMTARNS